jgi:hypothetical protein
MPTKIQLDYGLRKGCVGIISLSIQLHLTIGAPCPSPEKLFDNTRDSNIFIIVDLRQGFNQFVHVAKDRKKTTFHGSNKLWKWIVMPFGLKNAILSTNHGPSSCRGKFLEVLHR